MASRLHEARPQSNLTLLEGVGHFLMIEQQSFQVTDLIVGAVTVAMLGYVLNAAFLLIEKRLLHWHYGATRAND